MNNVLRYIFFLIIVRPLTLIILGLNVRHRHNLPKKGPAVIIANHNSHLDALVLITLFGMKRLHHVRPVAAADTFLKNKFIAWFASKIIGILPIDRKVKSKHTDHLKPITDALDQNQIILIFPEGTRGEPEKPSPMHNGVAHIAKRKPNVPIVPVFMHGLGKALPRNEAILVPFFCDVFIGTPHHWTGQKQSFMNRLQQSMDDLAAQLPPHQWS